MNSRGNNYQASMNHKAIIFQPFEQQGTRAEQFGTQNCNQTPEAAIRTTAQGEGKSSDYKKQWVKDEEAAQVVYEIGLYIMDGLGPSQIARKLTERNERDNSTFRPRMAISK